MYTLILGQDNGTYSHTWRKTTVRTRVMSCLCVLVLVAAVHVRLSLVADRARDVDLFQRPTRHE